MPEVTTPQQVPTGPNGSPNELQSLSALQIALISGVTADSLAGILGALPGISGDAAKQLLALAPLRSGLDLPPVPLAPGPVRNARAVNAQRRAQYLLNAARRLTVAGSSPTGAEGALDAEIRNFEAHQQAVRVRVVASKNVAQASERYGQELGWYAQRDSRTSPECRRAHGTNFRADRMPAIGYPGAVHTHCRCRPGKPFVRTEQEVAAVNNYPDDSTLIELARATGSMTDVAHVLGISRPSLTNYLLRRPVLDNAVRLVMKTRANPTIELALPADHKSSVHPDLPNKPGKTNWVEQEGGLPSFIKRVAKHIMADSGYTESRAIAAAISQCKKGKLGPKGLAAAAQWEAMKVSAHSHSVQGPALELAGETYNTTSLKNYLSTPAAGSKTTKSGGAKKKPVVKTAAGAARYKVPIGAEIGSARDANAAKAQQNQGAVDKYKGVVGAKDRDNQVKSLDNNQLGELSRVAFSFKSSDPNVVALRNSVVGQLKSRGMDPGKFGYQGGGGPAKPAVKAPVKVVAKKPAPKPVAKKAPPPPPPKKVVGTNRLK